MGPVGIIDVTRYLGPPTWVLLFGPLAYAAVHLGLILLGLAFIAMVLGSLQAREHGLAGPQWLLVTYVVYTWGELCLSRRALHGHPARPGARGHPDGDLSSARWPTSATGHRFSKRLEVGDAALLDGLPGFYLMLVVFPIAAGLLILLLTPRLRRMMHGVK
jgi:POT family proton-dependent oligopeptide transporter